MLNWKTARIIDIRDISDKTAIFQVEIEDVSSFEFIPGQFITFDLPIHEKRNKRLRSYSIASPPNKTNVIELIIGKVANGWASEYLFDRSRCNIGTQLPCRGPLGVFNLPKDLDKHYIFVCTGTGVAPFRSMIRYIKENDIAFHAIDLVFGARYQEDILYKAELEELDKEMPNFSYHVCLSREEYKGYQGYVHKVYHRIAAADNQLNVKFMFCGWRDMIDQARSELLALNYTKEQIHFELYG